MVNTEFIINISENKSEKITLEEFKKNLDELLNEENFNYLLRLIHEINNESPLKILLYTIIKGLWKNPDIRESVKIIEELDKYNRKNNIYLKKKVEIWEEYNEKGLRMYTGYYVMFFIPYFYTIWSILLKKSPEIIEKIIEYTYYYKENKLNKKELYLLEKSFADFIFLQMYENPKESYQILRDLYRKNKDIVSNMFDIISKDLKNFVRKNVYPYYSYHEIYKKEKISIPNPNTFSRKLHDDIKKDNYEDFIDTLYKFNNSIKYKDWLYAFKHISRIY